MSAKQILYHEDARKKLEAAQDAAKTAPKP